MAPSYKSVSEDLRKKIKRQVKHWLMNRLPEQIFNEICKGIHVGLNGSEKSTLFVPASLMDEFRAFARQELQKANIFVSPGDVELRRRI